MSIQLQQEATRRAIAAAKVLLGRELVISTGADLTPAGTRTARVVRHSISGRRTAPQIRLYVRGKAFRSLPVSGDNANLAREWLGNA